VSGLSGAAAKLGIPVSTLESKIRSLKWGSALQSQALDRPTGLSLHALIG